MTRKPPRSDSRGDQQPGGGRGNAAEDISEQRQVSVFEEQRPERKADCPRDDKEAAEIGFPWRSAARRRSRKRRRGYFGAAAGERIRGTASRAKSRLPTG